MFLAQSPLGKSGFILRGAWTPRGKKNIAKVSVLDEGSVDRVIWDLSTAGGGAFSVVAFPDSVSGAGASDTSMTIRTTTTEIAVEGAVGDLTYSWAKTSGAGSWSIGRASSASTSFTANNVLPYTPETAEFTCTVTDGAGRIETVTVDASARNYGDLTSGSVEVD